MATRRDDLDAPAVPVANRLDAQYGNFKHVMSAAILAFDWLPGPHRDAFMARAGGQDVEIPPLTEIDTRKYLEQAMELARKLPEESEPGRRAKPSKSK